MLRWEHVNSGSAPRVLYSPNTVRSQRWPLCCCSCSFQFLMARCTAASARARVAVSHRIFDACASGAAMSGLARLLQQAWTCALVVGCR